MRASAVVLALAAIGLTYAHTVVDRFYVNGVAEGVGKCLRRNRDGGTRSNPVENLASKEMACGYEGDEPVDRTCPVKAGDTVTFEWNNSNLHLADSHKGPCSFMMKKVDSAVKAQGSGDGWFRIFYEGYNNATKKWCTERMMADGRLSVSIPSDLAGGDYLLRSELLALHSASSGDPQFYISCAQIFLESSGSAVPTNAVSLPSDAYAKAGSPAMTFSYYYPDDISTTYPNYGPPTYKSSGQSSGGAAAQKQTTGLRPSNCIFEIESWCAPEVPKYTDLAGKQKSVDECWATQNLCWKSTYFDNSNCKILKTKCDELGASPCSASDCNGPPNYMKDLTPAKDSPANVPPPLNDGGAINKVSRDPTSASVSSTATASSTLTNNSAGTKYTTSSPSSTSAVSATAKVSFMSKVKAVNHLTSDTATTSSSPYGGGSASPQSTTSPSPYGNSSANSQSTSDAVVDNPTTPSGTGPTPTTSPTDSCEDITETVIATVTTTVQPKGAKYRRM